MTCVTRPHRLAPVLLSVLLSAPDILHPMNEHDPQPPQSPEASQDTPNEPPEAPPESAASTASPASEPGDDQPPALSRPRPLPRRIALLNQKGGVGKTTTTANLGAALAKAGHHVLLVDLDPQAHLTLHVGVDPDAVETSIYDLLVDDDVSAFDVTRHLSPQLGLLPAEVNLAGAETELASKLATGQAQRILATKCQPLIEQHAFDYVLIDCPPSLGVLSINALTLANEVFVPMQAHYLALQGLSKLLETVRFIQQSFNPQLCVTGVVLCMHEQQTILSKEVVGDLESFFQEARGSDQPWGDAAVLRPPVRRNIKLAECPSFGQTIFDYAPESNGAADYFALAQSVIQQQG